MTQEAEHDILLLPCREASAAEDGTSLAQNSSKPRPPKPEATYARLMRERAQKDYALQMLREQVQQLSEELVSTTSGAWQEGAQASSRTWGRILAHFEVKVSWPLVMRAAFATWQAAVQASRHDRLHMIVRSELHRVRVRQCVASSALVMAKETCQRTLAAVLCFSAWARLCRKGEVHAQSCRMRRGHSFGNASDQSGSAVGAAPDLEQPMSEPTNESATSLVPSPLQFHSELESLLAGQHRMQEWLVGLSAKQNMLQQYLTGSGQVDMSTGNTSQGNSTECCQLAIATSTPPPGTEEWRAAGQAHKNLLAVHGPQQLEQSDTTPAGATLRSAAAVGPDPASLLPAPVEEKAPPLENESTIEPSSPSTPKLRHSASLDSTVSLYSNPYGLPGTGLAQGWQKMMSHLIGDKAQEHPVRDSLLVSADLREEYFKGPPDTAMAHFVQSHIFNMFMGALIFANTLTIGIEADANMRCALKGPQEEVPSIYSAIGMVFSICFGLELVVKLFSLKCWFFIGEDAGWNIFDMFLVFSSVFQLIASGFNVNFFRVLRAFRMVRALRILRIMRMFRELRRMTLAILSCLASLTWAFVLLLLITYVFSILFMQAAAGYVQEVDEGDVQIEALAAVYGNLGLTMYSLVQAISGGNDWANIAGPIEPVSTLHTLIFIFYVLFVTYGVLNVLTGVFLEGASEIMDRDLITQAEISRKKAFANDLRQLFSELDLNKDGVLCWEEFRTALSIENVQAFLTSQQLDDVDAHLLFKLLAGKGEEVSEEDFIFGCIRLKGDAKSMHINHLHQVQQRLSHELRKKLELLTKGVSDVQLAVSKIPVVSSTRATAPVTLKVLPDVEEEGNNSPRSATRISLPDNYPTPAKFERQCSALSQEVMDKNAAEWHDFMKSRLSTYKNSEGHSPHKKLSDRIRIPEHPPKTYAAKVALGSIMNGIMGLLIFVNTLFIGFETDAAIRAALDPTVEVSDFYSAANTFFVICFTFECVFKICALRLWFFVGDDAQWNIFDTLLVISSLGQLFLSGLNVNFLRVLRVFRMIRALRILRVLRMFSELRRMTLAIVNCLASLAWAFLLLLLITYLFAILFVQAATSHVSDSNTPEAEVKLFQETYGNLPVAIYSLVQAVSGGNDWAAIAEPLQYISVVYTLLFLVYELFVTFGVLNVLTGVFLESASEIMDRDLITQGEVSRRKIFVRDMQTLFQEIDDNNSGKLTWREFDHALQDPSVSAFFTSQELDTLESNVLFKLIAGDNEEVSINDFILGCTKLRGSARSMHLQNLHMETTRFYERAKQSLQVVKDDMCAVRRELTRLGQVPTGAELDMECGVPVASRACARSDATSDASAINSST